MKPLNALPFGVFTAPLEDIFRGLVVPFLVRLAGLGAVVFWVGWFRGRSR